MELYRRYPCKHIRTNDKKYSSTVNYVHADNELDGEMLLELVADHNAADFKEICPVLRYRLKVRSIVKKATDCQVSMEASSGSTIFLPAAKVITVKPV